MQSDIQSRRTTHFICYVQRCVTKIEVPFLSSLSHGRWTATASSPATSELYSLHPGGICCSTRPFLEEMYLFANEGENHTNNVKQLEEMKKGTEDTGRLRREFLLINGFQEQGTKLQAPICQPSLTSPWCEPTPFSKVICITRYVHVILEEMDTCIFLSSLFVIL